MPCKGNWTCLRFLMTFHLFTELKPQASPAALAWHLEIPWPGRLTILTEITFSTALDYMVLLWEHFKALGVWEICFKPPFNSIKTDLIITYQCKMVCLTPDISSLPVWCEEWAHPPPQAPDTLPRWPSSWWTVTRQKPNGQVPSSKESPSGFS